MECVGHNGQVRVAEEGLYISRKGALAFISQGLKGEKYIPFASISAVQYRDAGWLNNGYIQFSVLGGIESRRGILDATADENTVMFRSGAQALQFAKLRDYVTEVIRRSTNAKPELGKASIADELGKLADLKDRGILTQGEFEEQKANLLR